MTINIFILNNKTNNVTLVWNDSFEICDHLFYSLNSIIEIDLSEFNTSKVKSMYFMFYNCTN